MYEIGDKEVRGTFCRKVENIGMWKYLVLCL